MGKSTNFSRVTGKNGLPQKTTVYLTTALTDVANNTGVTLSWEAAEDDAGAWDSDSPARVTVPSGVTGMRILLHAEWGVPAAVAAGDYRSLRIFVNGDQAGTVGPSDPYYSVTDVRAPNGTISDHQTCVGLMVRPLNPGTDYIEAAFRQVSGATLTLLASGTFMDFEWLYD